MPQSVGEWLSAFLQAHGLEKPDGRPLYAYRCDRGELQSLAKLLHQTLQSRPANLGPKTQQALCLWASEEFRRSYRGGVWNWADILERIDAGYWAPGSPGYSQLHDAVARGLKAWGRDLLRTPHERLFLITLVCEGGLPLYLVQREQARLRTYFRALFEEVRAHQLAGLLGRGTSVQDLARRVGHVLPASLRQDVVFELSGQLISKVWELLAEVTDAEDPILALDLRHAGWRQELPLDLEDELARTFLNGLVKEARAVAHGEKAGVEFTRSLVVSSRRYEGANADGQSTKAFELFGQLLLPPALSAKQFAELFGDTPPSRFELCLVADDGGIEPVALGTLRADGGEVRIEPMRRSLRPILGSPACAERSLLVRSAQGRLGPSLQFRGALELSALPWIFAPTDQAVGQERFNLAGEGSHRARDPEVLVAVPPGWDLCAEGSAACSSLGTVWDAREQRRVWRVSGSVVIDDGAGTRCRVTTDDASAPAAPDYRLAGRLLELGQHNTPVFRGFPTLVRATSTGFAPSVVQRELQWRLARPGAHWLPLPGPYYGDGHLRHVVEGRAQFTTRIRVVPPKFGVAFRPLGDAEGIIEFEGSEGASAGIHPTDGVTWSREPSTPGNIAIRVRASRAVPTSLTANLVWPAGGALDLVVPFPANQIGFVTLGGRRITPGTAIAVSQLAGMRAMALVPSRGHTFRLEGTLVSAHSAISAFRRSFMSYEMTEDPPGMHSLDLGVLQQSILNQLNSSQNLDCSVRLAISSDDLRNVQCPTLSVKRYDMEFAPGADGTTLRIPGETLLGRTSVEIEELRADAVSLLAPNADPVGLERVGVAEWSVERAELSDGPWLVLGWSGDWCRVRPRLHQIRRAEEQSTGDVTRSRGDVDLAAASAIRTKDERIEALRRALERLAADLDHPDWQLLKGHIRLSEKLPPSTFDTICALGENPQAAALAALIVPESEPELFDVCWRALNSLPFSWLAVSRDLWQTAFTRWITARYEALQAVQLEGVDPAQMISAHCFDPVRSGLVAEGRMPWLLPVLEIARFESIGIACSAETQALRRPMVREVALAQYWDAVRRIAPAPVDAPDPVPRTYELFQMEHLLAIPDAARLKVDPSRQLGVVGDARIAYFNAPAIAATSAIFAQAVTANAQVELRNAYEYDPSWFSDAYHWAYLYLLGSRT